MQFDNDPYAEFHSIRTADPVSADSYQSQWEFLKATSLYHFDQSMEDQRTGSFENPLYIPLLRFEGDWSSDLSQAMSQSKIMSPVGTDTSKNRIRMEYNDYQKWGYANENELYQPLYRMNNAYFGFFQQMADFFWLDQPLQVRCDIQPPGQCFYYHIDNFSKLLEKDRNDYTRFADCDHDQRKIMRIIVFLTDQEFGHVWHQGNLSLRWRRGDCFTYPWRDVPHGTANFGHTTRAALNITGRVNDYTWERLKNLPKKVNLSETR